MEAFTPFHDNLEEEGRNEGEGNYNRTLCAACENFIRQLISAN
jgi:hypothetical protein